MEKTLFSASPTRPHTEDDLRVLTERVRGMQEDIPSPCVGVCRIDTATRLCAGCYRTAAEIASWGSSDAASKKSVWQQLKRRFEVACTETPRVHAPVHRTNPE